MSECAGAECGHVSCTKVARARQRAAYPRVEKIRVEDAVDGAARMRALEDMLEEAQQAAAAHLFHKRYIQDHLRFPGHTIIATDASCAPVLGVHRQWCTCETR